MTMENAAIKLELLERLASIRDENMIRQIMDLLKKSFPEAMEEDEDFTDEEVAELDTQRADRISGKVKFISEEESIRMIRTGRKA